MSAETPLAALAKCRVYGRQAALTVEHSFTRSDGFPTLTLEMAATSGGDRYDWDHKVALQLTRGELPLFVAAVVGIRPQFEARFHGAARNKGAKVTRQDNQVLLTLSQAGRILAVPVSAGDAFHLAAFAAERLASAYPDLDSQTVLGLLRHLPGT